MQEYVLFTDSSADLGAEMVAELGVEVQPLTFTMDDGTSYQNWPDGRDMATSDFYAKLRAGSTASTSQVNTSEFLGVFRPFLEAGKEVLYLGFSSGLSGTVGSAQVAAADLAEEIPGARLVVVDTLAASLGQGLLVWHAAQLKKQGKSLDEVAAWVEGNKLKMAHWFTVDDLHFLKRGGRVSSASAFFGTMLNIKPILHVDDEGHLIPMAKERGRKRSLDVVVNYMKELAVDPDKQMVFISHSDCLEDAEYVADEVRRRFGTKEIYINYIGPVIGSHTGPGTLALFFLGSHR